VELEPSYADGYGMLAVTLIHLGKLDEAMAALDRAKQLNPRYSYIFLWIEGRIHFLSERYDVAASRIEEVVARNPVFEDGHIVMAAIYGQMGRIDDAQWEAEEILALQPGFRIDSYMSSRGYRLDEHEQRFVQGLRLAGLPE